MGLAGLAKDWKFWVLTALSIVLFVLVIVNIRTYSANQAQRTEVVSRQQYINEAIQLSRFNTQFVQMLANLAAQTNDDSLRKVLADHGITYTVTQPPQNAAEKKP